MDISRVARSLSLLCTALATALCATPCATALAQDSAFGSTSWTTPFPAPIGEPLSSPLSDERVPLRRLRLSASYATGGSISYSRSSLGGESAYEYRDVAPSSHAFHATAELPLVPAVAVGARAGFRSWEMEAEHGVGLGAHTTFDLGALLVVRIPWFWGWSLDSGGMRLLGTSGLSVDTLGWDDRTQTTTLSGRAGWHAGAGMGFEWLIAGRVALFADLLYLVHRTRLYFDVPGGAAGTLWYRTYQLSLALGVSVVL